MEHQKAYGLDGSPHTLGRTKSKKTRHKYVHTSCCGSELWILALCFIFNVLENKM